MFKLNLSAPPLPVMTESRCLWDMTETFCWVINLNSLERACSLHPYTFPMIHLVKTDRFCLLVIIFYYRECSWTEELTVVLNSNIKGQLSLNMIILLVCLNQWTVASAEVT